MNQFFVMLRNVDGIVGKTTIARSFKKIEDALNFSIDSVRQVTDDSDIIEFVTETLKSYPSVSFDTERDQVWELEIKEVEVEE